MTRILIVDDEKDLVNTIAEQLESNGYETGYAYDGVEGILKVMDGGWEAMLLDLRMPKVDGVSALRIIRRVAPKLPVITFTGQASQQDMVESVRLGAYICLLKPIKIEELLKTLELMLLKP